MILAPRLLLTALILIPYIAASNTNAFDNETVEKLAALSLQDPTKAPQSAATLEMFLNFIDYSAFDALNIGAKLRDETLNADLKTTVAMINEKLYNFIKKGHEASIPEKIKEKLDCFAKQGHDVSAIADIKELDKSIMQRFNTAAGVMLHGFFDDSNLDIMSLVKIAIGENFVTLLQFLQLCHVWSSPEQFHWFQAHIYKQEGYDPFFWQTHSMDWSKHLQAILQADNPIFLNDIIATNTIIFVQTAEQISPDIRQLPKLAKWLENLVESEQMGLLYTLLNSKVLSNLHLEDCPPPNKLPSNITVFRFFWSQGYCYLPVSRILTLACESGRDDILEFLYQLNQTIMNPIDFLGLAAKNGHFKVLNWALTNNLDLCREPIGLNLIENGHFEIYEKLQRKLKLSMSEKQLVSNKAAEDNCLNVTKWVYDKFGVVPHSKHLRNTSIEMLEWVKSINPRVISEDLAKYASLNILKWLLENHPRLLTENVKNSHNNILADLEKIEWMISQGWKVRPNLSHAVHFGKIKVLEFGYKRLQMKPTKDHVYDASRGGHTRVLELIYSVDPSYINVDTLLTAVQYDHLETAKYLESILNLKDKVLDLSLWNAFGSGNLDLINWAYEYYNLKQPESIWLRSAIEHGHLHIIDWAIETQSILKTDEECLITASEHDQHLIFRRLANYGMVTTKAEYLVRWTFENGSLGVMKYLVEKNPENAKYLRDKNPSTRNYHVWLWLQNQAAIS